MPARRPFGPAGVVLALALLAGIGAVDAGPSRFAGHPLREALGLLEAQGLHVLYSSELVRDDMRVAEEPRGRWPRESLDEMLAPFGLRASDGPEGVLLIVKAPPAGTVRGVVRGAEDSVPLAGVHVVVADTRVDSVTDDQGRFTLFPLPPGPYELTASRPGYLPRTVGRIPVEVGRVTEVPFELNRRNVGSTTVVVHSDDPAARRGRPGPSRSLRRDQIGRSPALTHDPLLGLGRLAGITVGDTAAEMTVRGGARDEVMVVLDGLELYEPFHLRDRGGPFSIIDSRIVGGLDFRGGAFTAEYGGRMSGVIELDSAAPGDDLGATVAVGSDDVRASGQGAFLDGAGRWLVSARRGDPSQLLDAVGADPSYTPVYHDIFGKVAYELGNGDRLSLFVLRALDRMQSDDDAPVETVRRPGAFRSFYENDYTWLRYDRTWTPRLVSSAMLSVGRLSSTREGSDPRVSRVDDQRETQLLQIKQDWAWRRGRHVLKWGADLRHLQARYRYTAVFGATRDEPVARAPPASARRIAFDPRGDAIGLYVSDALRLGSALTLQLGLRWDSQTYDSTSGSTLSPRVNAVYALGPRSTVRAGWGHFYQPQRINELPVQDGVREFSPPQRSEHRSVDFEHELPRGVRLRVGAYHKLMTDLQPRFENLFDPFGFFPEADGDRVRIAPDRATAKGLEVGLQGPEAARLSWWASYALASVDDRIDGRRVPRSWDHRHGLDLGLSLRVNPRWDVSLAGTFHTGRPTTPLRFEERAVDDGSSVTIPVAGERNSERLPAYHRLDVSVRRSFRLRGTEFGAWLNVANLYGRRNVCCVDAVDLGLPLAEGVARERRLEGGLPRLLTFGVTWTF